jgi:hypothetical protein
MKSTNPTPFVVAALIVAAGAYWFFFVNSGDEIPLTTGIEQNAAQTRFKMLVSELTSIEFNTAIFNDARFMSLEDLSTPVQQEAAGRLDPFAPLPGVTEK